VVAASKLVGAPSGWWVGLLLATLDTLALGVQDATPLRLLSLAPIVLALPLLGLASDRVQTATRRAQRVAETATRDYQLAAPGAASRSAYGCGWWLTQVDAQHGRWCDRLARRALAAVESGSG